MVHDLLHIRLHESCVAVVAECMLHIVTTLAIMTSQWKQNPVWDNPNIDSGIYAQKLQKQNLNCYAISYWIDRDPIQIRIRIIWIQIA